MMPTAAPVADPVRDVVADDRAGRARENDEQQIEIPGRCEGAADDERRLARHEREERIDGGDAEDDEVAPPRPGYPLGDLVEVEPVGHARILAERR